MFVFTRSERIRSTVSCYTSHGGIHKYQPIVSEMRERPLPDTDVLEGLLCPYLIYYYPIFLRNFNISGPFLKVLVGNQLPAL